MSLIGAFYYLKVVKVMYFDNKDVGLQVANTSFITRSILIINGSLILLLGIAPNWMLNFCTALLTL